MHRDGRNQGSVVGLTVALRRAWINPKFSPKFGSHYDPGFPTNSPGWSRDLPNSGNNVAGRRPIIVGIWWYSIIVVFLEGPLVPRTYIMSTKM